MNKPALLAPLFLLLLAPPPVAHAELRLGGQVDLVETDITQNCPPCNLSASIGQQSSTESRAGIGAFAQFRHTLDSDLVVGAHLGYGRNSNKVIFRDFSEAAAVRPTPPGTPENFDTIIQTGATTDLLGLLSFSGDSYIPVIMFGYSRVDVTGSGGSRNIRVRHQEQVLTGWKFAFGAEFAFTEDLILHALLQYADYDGRAFGASGGADSLDVSITQQSLRLGFAFRF